MASSTPQAGTPLRAGVPLSPTPHPSDNPASIPTKSVLMESLEDITYGSIAGIVGKYIEYPFDTIKVRLQSQPTTTPLYTGPLDCFKQSLKFDGPLGLYRGITAPLVGAAMETSSLFFFERLGRDLVYWSVGTQSSATTGELPKLPLSALWFTGAFSGAFTSFVLTPVELVKCKIQVPATSPSSPTATLKPMNVIKQIYLHDGLAGFWHGQTGTFLREAGGCAAWFGAKETVSDLFLRSHLRHAATQTEKDVVAAKALPLWEQAVAGATAGMAYNFLFFPADTIKSRMQTSPMGGGAKKSTFFVEGAKLWKEAGLKGLYRGCGVTVLRSAPSSAFIFMVYDGLKRHFHFA